MKLAFIGTGKIIHDAIYAITPLKKIEKTAVFAREHSRDKAEKLSQEYGIKEIFTNYDKLLEESQADTVYIGLINSAHYPYAKKALEAGKNVILEKPFTGFYEQSKELQEIAEKNGLVILEAVTILHNEIFEKMRENLEKLGNIRMFSANYSQYSSGYDDYLEKNVKHSFDKKYYGGALYDINVYNIHYCVGLFGEPREVKYYPILGFNGVDTSGVLIMEYDDFTAVCTGAKDSDSPGYVCIQGEKGYMRIDSKPNIADELKTVYVDESIKEKVRDKAGAMVRATITQDYKAKERFHRMSQEFEDFAKIIDSKNYELAKKYTDESVIVSKILQKARESADIEFIKE